MDISDHVYNLMAVMAAIDKRSDLSTNDKEFMKRLAYEKFDKNPNVLMKDRIEAIKILNEKKFFG